MNRLLLLFALSAATAPFAFAEPDNLSDPYRKAMVVALDTFPDLDERFGDFITNPNANPFDLQDPNAIEQNVEYDPATGQYIITEKIGDDYYRPPTFLSFDEYMELRRKQDEQRYFSELSGASSSGFGGANDPIAEIDVKENLLERLFGGTQVDIRPQGNIDLTFGVRSSRTERPDLPERQRNLTNFDFDMDINMNVVGKIGEKLNLTTTYNTNANFNFDNQIKLDYNSDNFAGGEDAILQKIEAGNVSLPLRGNLIQGGQSLFGLKTELKFGHLRLTAIASQQRSQRENIQIEGGSQVQEFEVRADEYDENRHFLLTHYNRDNFNRSLRNLPQVNSLFKIKKLEVWITNDRNEVTDVRDIVALADLAEPTLLVSPDKVTPNPNWNRLDLIDRKPLPDNAANDLYSRIISQGENIRNIDRAVATLRNEFDLQQNRDFEKVSARKLQPSEYTFHPELGFISVNINVQPDQVLGVAFEYEYNGNIYRVGEMSINNSTVGTDTTNLTPKVLFVKMLKSMTQRTDVPTWDLMMKNVYSIGAFQVNQQDFRLDIFYDDPGAGQKRFIPETEIAGIPLLRVFNLDNLNTQGDPQPDGIFDFVPGVTINPRNGRIMFPVLEPFGSDLSQEINDEELRRKYVYDSLYETTKFLAQESAEQNRFIIRGEYKSSVSSEISLGAFNIPQGSVSVRAGGQELKEGIDYEVDYAIGKVRILNDAILQSGVPVNISFEDNTLFGFQQKTMVGLRADYQVDENFNIGATFLKLFERPFTQKVNVGDDPINNNIYGLDMNLSRQAPWLTRAVDALPGISTKEPSSITVAAEVAAIQPGHARAINQNSRDKGGVVYIDDFEGSGSSFDLRAQANRWRLASVPGNDAQNNNPRFPEGELINDLRYGANRAMLNWYRIDQVARNGADNDNIFTSQVMQTEVFPNLQLQPNQLPNIQTFDLRYYPNERGPYNFDVPDGYPGFSRGVNLSNGQVELNDPSTRWAGIMRDLTTNDFQSANIEFLEFWMLSPFLDESGDGAAQDAAGREGDLYINLGNVSEDVLRDSRLFFENGLPGPANPNRRTNETAWSRVPVSQQITRAFDNDEETRALQDVGLDGLSDEDERDKYADYLAALSAVNAVVASQVAVDPAQDNFRYYNDGNWSNEEGVYDRYRQFNNPDGNSRSASQNTGNQNLRQTGTNVPDSEDLNQDNTLNESEAYFEYKIPLRRSQERPGEIDTDQTPFITDQRVADNGRIWYRFRIPLDGPQKRSVGGIRDFRSIQFMRMYLQEFEAPVTLRFARLELVRNQWRRYRPDLSEIGGPAIANCNDDETAFTVDNVNIEENNGRLPFNYVLPDGIQRERAVGVFTNLQNEQSLTMDIEDLCNGAERAIFKVINMDMRVYERFKMFIHAEETNGATIPDGATSIFVRLGSDFQGNYYEYEIPLTMSQVEDLMGSPNSPEYKRAVWRPDNEFDFGLQELVDLKKERNAQGVSLADEYSIEKQVGEKIHKLKIRGNPSVGQVKVLMVGVRNPYDFNTDDELYDLEVWLNELRLTGLDERGGAAATARVDAQLADFGSVTMAGNFSSIGFGALDQKVQERARERITGYDFAVNFNLDKFLPERWGLRLPLYAQLSNTTTTPEFDPYDLDITLDDKLRDIDSPEVRDSVRSAAQEVTTIRSVNLTNVRKERTDNSKAPMPWDISNFSASYSYTETEYQDPIIEFNEEEQHTGAIDYSYSRRANYIQPLKAINVDALKLISEFNFNPLPNSFTFSSVMNRTFETTSYRFTDVAPQFRTFYNKRFTWNRDYDLQWDLTKSLKFNFNATNSAVIDEPDETALVEQFGFERARQIRRDSIWTNIQQFGRPKNYQHNISVGYDLPIKHIPLLKGWVTAKVQYQGNYNWSAAALNVDSLGNVIQNNQNRTADLDFDLERLYDKIGYLRKINRGNRGGASRGRAPSPRGRGRGNAEEEGQDEDKKDRDPSTLERVLVRPLLSVRRVRFNYNEQFSTTVPGYMPRSEILGLNNFESPGWDFVAGLQPNIRNLTEDQRFNPNADNLSGDWLRENERWITGSSFLNQEVQQTYSERFDAKATIEPFQDFRIDLELNRTFQENFSESFKDTLPGDGVRNLVHTVPYRTGSMQITYNALSTLFNDSDDDITALFSTFEANRIIISQRLGEGVHQDENLGQQGYSDGYGNTQQEVILPAFIAAYRGEDPNNTRLNIFDQMPSINWRLQYNGLSRVPFFSKVFQNFSLSHGYNSTLSVNNFRTSLPYLATRSTSPIDTGSFNFYPRLEIADVVIQESFAPLIGLDMTLTNGISFNVDYKKSRTLALSTVNYQLNETQSEEFTVGFGYLIRNVDIPFLTGSGKRKNNRRDEEEAEEENQSGRNNNRRGGGGGRGLQGQDLDINFDMSIRDDVTFAHRLDEGIREPTRGNYALSLSPSVEYAISQRLSLRLFFDYRRTVPATSAGFPRTDASGGVIVRFQLN
ncbi:T9SS outer membrane translocon Sov/SprA [Phaeodactylibacter luteus]|nr:cell surface protein SprA [Phaeodactylibacter luteus]